MGTTHVERLGDTGLRALLRGRGPAPPVLARRPATAPAVHGMSMGMGMATTRHIQASEAVGQLVLDWRRVWCWPEPLIRLNCARGRGVGAS